jgi:hypothetical protein
VVVGNFQAQTTGQQLVLAAAANPAPTNVAADYGSVALLLCSTSGTCCTTNLCNTMNRIEMNFVAMLMSMALALFGALNGF